MELFPLISPNFACRTLLLIVFLGGSPAGTSVSSCMAPRGKLRPRQVSAPDSTSKAAAAKRIHEKATLTHSGSGLERSALQTCQ